MSAYVAQSAPNLFQIAPEKHLLASSNTELDARKIVTLGRIFRGLEEPNLRLTPDGS